MSFQSRAGDRSECLNDAHGCPACPHHVVGPAIKGSPNVFVNGKPALRATDDGAHQYTCCGPNTWKAVGGSATVFINGLAAHRVGDIDQHCGGIGHMIEGSPDVVTG